MFDTTDTEVAADTQWNARKSNGLGGTLPSTVGNQACPSKPVPEYGGLVVFVRSQAERVKELSYAVDRLERAMRGSDSIPTNFGVPMPTEATCVGDEIMYANTWITWLTTRISEVAETIKRQ